MRVITNKDGTCSAKCRKNCPDTAKGKPNKNCPAYGVLGANLNILQESKFANQNRKRKV